MDAVSLTAPDNNEGLELLVYVAVNARAATKGELHKYFPFQSVDRVLAYEASNELA
jgi:hypothetical protein